MAIQSDYDIKRDVEDELRFDPDINATDIGVAVKDGVVTLTGYVRSYRQRRLAEQDTKRVDGVVGVVNDIEVRLPIIHRRPDPEIARDLVHELQLELPYTWDKIKVIVEDGWVTLEGEVEDRTAKRLAEDIAEATSGVFDVHNRLRVRATGPDPEPVKGPTL